ncbi:E3 ubiquitin-protein ligase ATL4 [Hibiscus syriacus]|uniref:RING-type E3 ubiquitin transferase n=1 Tax=Hibiscus syriacus TaxID=106335 RepID=A0A6A2Y057_HIBSY|nr:E3 ubiquitin-protein ligase ATL4 [Hibiscus syriacus]
MASMSSSPPPLLYGVIGVPGTAGENSGSERSHASSSSFEGAKPSIIIIIILILSVTLLVSVSLCLFLWHLNQRCLRHLSPTTTTVSVRSNRGRLCFLILFLFSLSLPLFTLSSITRRSNNDSKTGDCAVCLSKFEPEDQLRLLPFCCHAFHAHCIDTWLSWNQTCPLCRSPLFASESDLIKSLLQSSNAAEPIASGRTDSFHLEIGSVSLRRQPGSESGEQRRSYSIGSFDYIIEEETEVTRNETHQRNVSDKEELAGAEAASEASLAAEVATGRSWLKEYVDRLSSSLSSRALSFRSSGRFFTGSSRRSDIAGTVGEYDVEANRIGEEISEMFRWFSGV